MNLINVFLSRRKGIVLICAFVFARRCADKENKMIIPTKFTNQKARDLGVKFKNIETMLRDTVASLKQKGFIVNEGSKL